MGNVSFQFIKWIVSLLKICERYEGEKVVYRYVAELHEEKGWYSFIRNWQSPLDEAVNNYMSEFTRSTFGLT